MIHTREDTNDSEMTSMPLLFTPYDNYLQSSASFQEAINSAIGDNE